MGSGTRMVGSSGSSARPAIEVRGLLSSCATPETSWPMEARLLVQDHCPSIARCSVTSSTRNLYFFLDRGPRTGGRSGAADPVGGPRLDRSGRSSRWAAVGAPWRAVQLPPVRSRSPLRPAFLPEARQLSQRPKLPRRNRPATPRRRPLGQRIERLLRFFRTGPRHLEETAVARHRGLRRDGQDSHSLRW